MAASIGASSTNAASGVAEVASAAEALGAKTAAPIKQTNAKAILFISFPAVATTSSPRLA
jgi:hypothetical protein